MDRERLLSRGAPPLKEGSKMVFITALASFIGIMAISTGENTAKANATDLEFSGSGGSSTQGPGTKGFGKGTAS
jgi:hypothetical protein